jgi:tetratricopeptide (TPR) repeat protein
LVYGIYASWPWPHPTLGTDSLLGRGLAAADSAIALDSTSADGWLARGFLLVPSPIDADGWDGFRVGPNLMIAGGACRTVPDCSRQAVAALARAVELAPRNPEIWYQYGRSQLFTPEGAAAVERSLELEPDRAVSAWLLGMMYLRARRLEDAERRLDSAITLGRRDLSVFGLRLETRLLRGDLQGAKEDLDRVGGLVGADSVAAVYHATMRIALDVRAGDTATARARRDSLLRDYPPDRVSRHSMLLGTAAVLVMTGELDRGLGLLERVIGQSPGMLFRLDNDLWNPVRQDPRFRRLVERMGTEAFGR